MFCLQREKKTFYYKEEKSHKKLYEKQLICTLWGKLASFFFVERIASSKVNLVFKNYRDFVYHVAKSAPVNPFTK